MNGISTDLNALSKQAFKALRENNIHASLALFARICAAPEATTGMHLGHAQALLAARELNGMMAALDRVFAREPKNVLALILKADGLLAKGDARAAPPLYAAALRAAPANPPTLLLKELSRARDQVLAAAKEYEDFLRARLAQSGYDPARSSERFSLGLEILFGARARPQSPQRPQRFYLPGVSERGFHPPEDIPWMPELQQHTAAIRSELMSVLGTRQGFAPYVQNDPLRPPSKQAGMAGNEDWSAHYLWKSGAEVFENTAKCSETAEALRSVPLCDMPSRGPMALFSWLKPGARIPPHTGMLNTRLICHLPLIVPRGCGFRVGQETREWHEGIGWAFDDSFEHEAWNTSKELRVILIFDVWRPDVTPEERHFINAMFAAIDEYTGKPPEWAI